jgi:exonuclease SbcD
VKILHTADWHVGKRLGRFDRTPEYEAVIAEVVEIADREAVDLVVHAGDLFDRSSPPVESLRVAFGGLMALTGRGRRPVVVIAGNHDSGPFFDALAPFVRGHNIHLIGSIRPPGEGGVLTLDTSGGRALIACFPFLREGRVVDFAAAPDELYGQYADRVQAIAAAYAAHLAAEAGPDDVTLLVAHFLVGGIKLGGHGAPRGERELHMGEAYAAAAQAVPPSLGYVALGHVHAPQPVPGALVPAEYSGSLLEADFGEAGEEKRVVVVTARPGVPATTASVPLTAGRRLRRASGRWEDLDDRDDLDDAFLDLVVETDGPDPGLADRARERFPFLVKVATRYERAEQTERIDREGRPLADLYADYVLDSTGVAAPAELLEAFTALQEAVDAAT